MYLQGFSVRQQKKSAHAEVRCAVGFLEAPLLTMLIMVITQLYSACRLPAWRPVS